MPMLRATKSRVHIPFKSLELSPDNDNKTLRKTVLRINKIVFKGKMPWYFTKFS